MENDGRVKNFQKKAAALTYVCRNSAWERGREGGREKESNDEAVIVGSKSVSRKEKDYQLLNYTTISD